MIRRGGHFTFYGYGDVLREPPKKFLVQGLIGQEDLAMIFGPGKAGKSLVVFDLIATLIRGNSSFADRHPVGDPVQVVYATGEGQRGLPNRLQALKRKWELTDEEMDRLTIVKEVPQLFGDDAPAGIRQFVRDFVDQFGHDRLRGGLFIVDTWARATGGADENTSKDTTEILDALDYARRELGCTVLAVHHANKGGDIRGSSNIQAGFDSVIYVRKCPERDARLMGCDISKDAESAKPVSFTINSIEWAEGSEVHKGGTILWGGELQAEQAKQLKLEQELLEIVTTQALGEANALPISQVHERMTTPVSMRTLRTLIEEVTNRDGAVIRQVERQVRDSEGRLGRSAAHLFCDPEYLN